MEVLMLDLSESTTLIETIVESSLKSFAAKEGPPNMMFCHVHAYWGQTHIYLSSKRDLNPFEELIGKPIEYLIDHDDWGEKIGHLAPDGHVEFRLADGAQIYTKEESVINILGSQHVCNVVRSVLTKIDTAIVPHRIVVASQSCEFSCEWNMNYTEPSS
jgi:hypothetical protein